jgi:hypothetical protein
MFKSPELPTHNFAPACALRAAVEAPICRYNGRAQAGAARM